MKNNNAGERGGSITGSYITKDDSNDCITVVLTFKKTQDGKQRPDVPVKVVVRSYDMNKPEGQQEIQGAEKYYYVKAGSQATLMAPEYIKSAPDTAGLENEEFQKWVFDGSGLEPAEGYDVSDKTIKVNVARSVHANAVIKAEFYPVVTKIDAVLDPPCGGELIQMAGRNKPDEDDDTLTIKISNEYVIHKDNIRISWIPDPVGQEAGEKFKVTKNMTFTAKWKRVR